MLRQRGDTGLNSTRDKFMNRPIIILIHLSVSFDDLLVLALKSYDHTMAHD